ncbi:hypothetical protein [Halalkalibacter akibai]|uniref:Uncharacterized protein n=1 Tax=Halalkalibacter akibai (strain ATCC 43226 / DSM 21942 / CIP 109018 / JCM 9157 / 1139) TaxID=1236973 RepID=W4R185_HALA3|nr:hypothetical protein [Halalkalibacter akibai]GAE37663.1 hypothetical protein JCM9157_4980 [Halalkalibacter akibai JCM 9157]
MRDYNWCSLDPENTADIELFKSLVLKDQCEDQDKFKKDDPITIATVCLESNGYYTNVFRTDLLFQLIEKLDGKTDLILLPAGFYQTSDLPNTLYDKINDVLGKKLGDLNSSLSICLGIDGRDGLDQMAILVTKQGIESIGRKFFPTSYEEIDGANSYLSLEEGYERIFQIKKKRFYMAVCYDGFGIKKEKLKNPNVDVILDLVHRFHPKSEDISGDVLFAKHGFAGASKHWGCPVFGAAVFFNREVPTKWPTGVMWQTEKESTRYWRYTDNPMKHLKEMILQDEELAKIRFYTV